MKPTLIALLAVLIPSCVERPDPEIETRDLVANITSAILQYRRHVGSLDETENVKLFAALTGLSNPESRIYVPFKNSRDAGRFLDFWQRDLRFFRDARGNVIAWSPGRDGVFSTADDIRGDESHC